MIAVPASRPTARPRAVPTGTGSKPSGPTERPADRAEQLGRGEILPITHEESVVAGRSLSSVAKIAATRFPVNRKLRRLRTAPERKRSPAGHGVEQP